MFCNPGKTLHRTDNPAKGFYLFPVGEFHYGLGIGRPLGHPHDQSNHKAVNKPVAGIIDLAGKNGQFSGLPRYPFEKLLQVGIMFRLALLRFSGNDIYRKEGVGFALQEESVLLDEGDNLRTVFPIADTGADDDFIEGCHVNLGFVLNGNHGDLMRLLLYNLLQSLAYLSGLPIGC